MNLQNLSEFLSLIFINPIPCGLDLYSQSYIF